MRIANGLRIAAPLPDGRLARRHGQPLGAPGEDRGRRGDRGRDGQPRGHDRGPRLPRRHRPRSRSRSATAPALVALEQATYRASADDRWEPGIDGEDRLAPRALPGPALSGRRVVVIGAGLAGPRRRRRARAARAARSRCSRRAIASAGGPGRASWPNGAVIEMGAEFILAGNAEVTALAAELGLGLWDKGMRYGEREPRGGIGTSAEELAAGGGRGRARGRSARRQASVGARAARLAGDRARSARGDPRPRGDLLGQLGRRDSRHRPRRARPHRRRSRRRASPAATRGWRSGSRRGSAMPCGSATRRSRVEWGAGRGAGRDRAPAHAAEADALRDRGAGERHRPDRVRARAAGSQARGARRRPLRPRGEALRAACRARPGRRGDERRRALLVLDRDRRRRRADAGRQLLRRLAGGARAASGSPTARDRWLESLAALRPELALEPEGAVLSTWDDDPWVGAAYSIFPPPRLTAALAEPVGPLAFAGEHIGGAFNGLMEGAIRCGRCGRARRSVALSLNPGEGGFRRPRTSAARAPRRRRRRSVPTSARRPRCRSGARG